MSRRDDVESTNYSLVTDIFASPIANSSDGKGGQAEENHGRGWPLFGEEQEYKPTGLKRCSKPTLVLQSLLPFFFERRTSKSKGQIQF